MLPSMGKRDINGWAINRVSTCGSSRLCLSLLALASGTFLLSVHFRDQAVDDVRAGHAFGLRLEVREDAVSQHWLGDGFQILHAHKIASLQHRVGLRAAN